jgi:DNA-binding winged helix-turn-helix (wHTH) protein
MKYIINEKVIFDPDERKLTSVADPHSFTVLTYPSSYCFLLLLENSPSVVTQQQFFDEVWKPLGQIVPLNTLYQNISMIRRGLREQGETDKLFITTVPRQGFVINKKMAIRIADDSDDSLPETRSEIPHSTEAGVSELPVAAAAPTFSQRPWYLKAQGGILLLGCLIAGLIAGTVYSDIQRSTSFFSDYVFLDTTAQCQFYANDDDVIQKSDLPLLKSKLDSTGADCRKYPWVYITHIEHNPLTSVFLCKKKLSAIGNASCVSLLFRTI